MMCCNAPETQIQMQATSDAHYTSGGRPTQTRAHHTPHTGRDGPSPPRLILAFTAKVDDSAKIKRGSPVGRMEKRGFAPPGSAQHLPSSPPEASASRSLLFGHSVSSQKAKTFAQHASLLGFQPVNHRVKICLSCSLFHVAARLDCLAIPNPSIPGPPGFPLTRPPGTPSTDTGGRSNEAGVVSQLTGCKPALPPVHPPIQRSWAVIGIPFLLASSQLSGEKQSIPIPGTHPQMALFPHP
ncbi:hypothetical protein LX36DRAFT_279356 [Colletotrichum falcatum]|nr:hypothetical protein LX36DRAFT_279356 [Colletotrichum falcatum]